MPNHIFISGPVSWNSIVYLDHLPEPRPHMQFALEDFETVGDTSAGKALHLAGLVRKVTCLTVMGDDAASTWLRSVLESAEIELHCVTVPGASERHLNLMTRAGERVSLYLSTPAFPSQMSCSFARWPKARRRLSWTYRRRLERFYQRQWHRASLSGLISTITMASLPFMNRSFRRRRTYS
jgi:hypothetical protein